MGFIVAFKLRCAPQLLYTSCIVTASRRAGFVSAVLTLLGARPIAGQIPVSVHGRRVSSVSGVVYDSIARTPLAGAVVQLVRATDVVKLESTITDAAGHYTLESVPAGRYIIVFLHPVLDSLGIDPIERLVDVLGDGVVRRDLAIPAPKSFHAAVCGPSGATDSSGVILGILRDAESFEPIPNAVVSAQWREFTFGPHGIARVLRRATTMTRDNGWFALCKIASRANVAIVASAEADSTGIIELELPESRFVRRDLYIGSSRPLVVADSLPVAERAPLAHPHRRTGTATLSGTVSAAPGGQPITAAHVGIEDGPQTTTNDRGQWTLANAPPGTRMLGVRAVGYYPEWRPVDVIGTVGPIRVALSTLKAVLDTVTVRATRLYDRDADGFERRRRAGFGHYVGREEIERSHPMFTTDLLRSILSIRVDESAEFENRMLMRGDDGRECSPAIYVDDMRVDGLGGGDIDSWVRPTDVVGIEVYTNAEAPAEFQTMSDCGSIVIWTR